MNIHLFMFRFKFVNLKKVCWTEHEYMNKPPPPPPNERSRDGPVHHGRFEVATWLRIFGILIDEEPHGIFRSSLENLPVFFYAMFDRLTFVCVLDTM